LSFLLEALACSCGLSFSIVALPLPVLLCQIAQGAGTIGIIVLFVVQLHFALKVLDVMCLLLERQWKWKEM
jgi:hypothetical protein